MLSAAAIADFVSHAERSPFFLRRRRRNEEIAKISRDVEKLLSCSEAGRRMIVDQRCKLAGLHPREFIFRRDDDHLIPRYTPINEPVEVTFSEAYRLDVR